MPNKNLARVFLFVVFAFVAASQRAEGNDSASPSAPPVHLVVTAEARHGAEIPVIAPNEVQVYEGREKQQVTDWIPLTGDHAALQFFILIDDASSPSIGSQFDDIKAFIALQPATTLIGVGYMRDGTVDIRQNLTADHAAAAGALRLPLGNGGAFSGIYLSISDLIKRWPTAPLRREILVISDGIDQFGGSGPANPYVDTAIEDAQKAGVIVHAIYSSGVGHYARSYYRAYWGQNYLSQVADETGGEGYFLGYQTAVSFAPYLQDLARRLSHQYLLTFIPKPEKKGGLVRVKVRTEMSSVELIAASSVYVPPAADM